MAVKNDYFLWIVNSPQFFLKTIEFCLNFRNFTPKKKKKKTEKTLWVHEGYFGHFKIKTYFDHFKTFRGTFITLDVNGYFRHFLALMAYFNHFGWSDFVNRVNQSFLVGGYKNTCPKSDRWIGRMWWNICVCKLQWQSDG